MSPFNKIHQRLVFLVEHQDFSAQKALEEKQNLKLEG
jgi:hypothetical protein